ncbi:MAG: TonB family protein [Gemmatimonadota bacterium]
MSHDWEDSFQQDLVEALVLPPGAIPNAQPRSACEEERVFRGRVERVPAPQLLRALHESRETGVLVLKDGSREGRIIFQHGEAVASFAGPLRGLAALNRLLRRERGDFRFEARRVHPERNVHEPTSTLLHATSAAATGIAESQIARAGWKLGLDRARGATATALRSARLTSAVALRDAARLRRDAAVVAAAWLRQAGDLATTRRLRLSAAFETARLQLAPVPSFGASLELARARMVASWQAAPEWAAAAFIVPGAVVLTVVVAILGGFATSTSDAAGAVERPAQHAPVASRTAGGRERSSYVEAKREQDETRLKIARLEHLVRDLSGSIVTTGPAPSSEHPSGSGTAPAVGQPAIARTAGAAPAGEAPHPWTLKESRQLRGLVNRASGRIELVRAWTDDPMARTAVRLAVLVSAGGSVEDARVITPSGDPRLDDAALTSVRQVSYRPARRSGVAVPAWTEQQVAFRPE